MGIFMTDDSDDEKHTAEELICQRCGFPLTENEIKHLIYGFHEECM